MSTFTVSAHVITACSINAGQTLDFGNYTGAATPVQKSTTISVNCTNGGTYVIGLDGGIGGTDSQRLLAGPNSATLKYNLYQDSSYKTVWGNTTSTEPPSRSGTGSAETITVYGQLDGLQPVTVGSYSDTITATITY
jgi:spore coat protein U-like protein